MQLHPDAEARGVRLIAHDTLTSTNAEALSAARAGERGPLWVTAARQTAGRGRRGNLWTSEPGNLYASLLLTDAAPAAHLPELCFVAALAVRDAVASFLLPAPERGRVGEGVNAATMTPTRHASHVDLPLAGGGKEKSLRLKWPNDLLLDGAKLVGILIEAESVGGVSTTVAGIGVNCAHHPDDARYPATSLAAHGVTVTPADLFHALSAAMVVRVAQWDRGAGFAAVRAEWLAVAANLGSEIQVRLPDRELSGTFESLDATGRLMLRLPGGRLEAITAGEVFPMRVTA